MINLWLLLPILIYSVSCSTDSEAVNNAKSLPKSLFQKLSKDRCDDFKKDWAMVAFDFSVDKTGLDRFPLQVAIDYKNLDCINKIISVFKSSDEELDELLSQVDFLNNNALHHALKNFPGVAHMMITDHLLIEQVEAHNDQPAVLLAKWAKFIMKRNPMNYMKFLKKVEKLISTEESEFKQKYSIEVYQFRLIILGELVKSPKCDETSYNNFFQNYFSDKTLFKSIDLEILQNIFSMAFKNRCLNLIFHKLEEDELLFKRISDDSEKIDSFAKLLIYDIKDPLMVMLLIELLNFIWPSISVQKYIDKIGLEYVDIIQKLKEIGEKYIPILDVIKIIPAFSLIDEEREGVKTQILASFKLKDKNPSDFELMYACHLGNARIVNSVLNNLEKSVDRAEKFILAMFNSAKFSDNIAPLIRASIFTPLPSPSFPIYNVTSVKILTSILLSEKFRMRAENKFQILQLIFSDGLEIESVFLSIDWTISMRVFDLVVKNMPSTQDLLLQYFDVLMTKEPKPNFKFAFHVLEMMNEPFTGIPFEMIGLFLKARPVKAIDYIYRLLEMVDLETVDVTLIRDLFQKFTWFLAAKSIKEPNRYVELILLKLRR